MWCWHHIKDNLNGLCPACRTPYSDDPHAFSAVDRVDVIRSEKKQKRRAKSAAALAASNVGGAAAAAAAAAANSAASANGVLNNSSNSMNGGAVSNNGPLSNVGPPLPSAGRPTAYRRERDLHNMRVIQVSRTCSSSHADADAA